MTGRAAAASVDVAELEAKVVAMYRAVALNPHQRFHFELGRELAEHLGYPAVDLDAVPATAVESFAGVGYFFDLADIRPGETVVDLGSGSGTDAFIAARRVGAAGRVIGIEITPEQLAKAERARDAADLGNIEFRTGRIQRLPVPDDSADAVISNGVINLAPDKHAVFAEAARILRSGGQLVLADIVADARMPEKVVADSDLWASCVGGAAQIDDYQQAIAWAGMRPVVMRRNDYRFLSDRAVGASIRYGVRSISLAATRP